MQRRLTSNTRPSIRSCTLPHAKRRRESAQTMFEFLNFVRSHKGDKNGENTEMKYNPKCGVTKEVFQWLCHRQERVSSRRPELMRKMRGLTQRMRNHFQDDEEGLKKWDAYEENVLRAYEWNLQIFLSRPVMIPDSVLYKDLMKRYAYSKTLIAMVSEGFHKFERGTKSLRPVVAGAAAGFAFGLAVGSKQPKTK